jgi:hypothetical protein
VETELELFDRVSGEGAADARPAGLS